MSVSAPPPSGSTSRLAFPGAVLAGRYRLEEVVGYGGMGSVWRATHIGLGEEVAVKLVSAHFVRSGDALRRFDTEAKAAAKLRSRHAPQVFDNGVLDDGTPFLVMELLRGESLAARLGRVGRIPVPEVVLILEQCCRALARAHSLGIVHRDIKPENIYLAHSVDDEGYVVKVLDFGIAKITSSLEDGGHSSTRTGTLLGTPLYMSPEQARGLRSVDFPTDIYSLGLVGYTMLTGTLPFSGETLGELLLQICVERLPSLRAAAPELSRALDAWFQKACARLPEDRFASAQAFIDGLRVAAGISLPGAGDFAGARWPSPGAPGGPEHLTAWRADPGPMGASGPQPSPGAPSTTAGASLGGLRATGKGKPRWVWVGVSALVGLAAFPTLVFLVTRARGVGEVSRSPPRVGATSAADGGPVVKAPARGTLTPAGPGNPTLAPSPLSESTATSLPNLPSPLSPGAGQGDEALRVTPQKSPPAPLAAPAPPKQSSAPRTTSKPPGGIDLGY